MSSLSIIGNTYKSIIPERLITTIFKDFNTNHFYKELALIISHINSTLPDEEQINGIKFRGLTYSPYDLRKKVKLYPMNIPSSFMFHPFVNLLNKYNEYRDISARMLNYVKAGLAVAVCYEDLEEIFPQCLLNLFEQIDQEAGLPRSNYSEKNAVKPGIQRFREVYSKDEKELKMRLMRNLLTPDT